MTPLVEWRSCHQFGCQLEVVGTNFTTCHCLIVLVIGLMETFAAGWMSNLDKQIASVGCVEQIYGPFFG